jgi:hypothetical protein
MTSSQSQDIIQIPWFPKTSPPLAGGAQAGEWQGRDQQSLGTIAKSLVYEVSTTRVNSLPSPWSRALQFEQAVLNSRYPTRDSLLEELFGGMACLGLWEMFGLRMDAQRVALLEHADLNDDAVGSFSRSLTSSLPDGSTALSRQPDGRNPWEVIYIFTLQGSVVGFSSPSTLFCPTVHLPQPIQGMGWTGNGRFCSPISFLGSPQRQALADWFSHVKNGMLNAQDLHNQTTAGQMAGVLNLFISQLSGSSLNTPTLSDSGRVANLPANPVALALLSRPAKGGVSASQATLDLGDRLKSPLSDTPTGKPVVLVDPEMPNKLGISAADICLYKSATLESIGFDPKQLERQYGQEIFVITPDQIFLDELYLVSGEQALQNSWLPSRLEGVPRVNGKAVTPLLPLRPEIRRLFSSRELQERCQLRVMQSSVSSELEIRIELPLQGQRDAYVISRTFQLKERNLVAEDLPVITLWPYVSDERWSLYYLFCEDSPTALTVDGFADYDRKLGRDGQQVVKYFTSPHFPDLVRLAERGQDRGLIPVTPPTSSSDMGTQWRVGIDFGTSFSNFFIDEGGGPQRRHLDTRVISLTLSQKEERQRLLNQYFVPEEMLPNTKNSSNPPTATAISLRGWQEVLGEVPELFHEARLRVPTPGEFGGAELRTGFKWEQMQYQKPFLKELALLISANAAANGARELQWSVSYPSAFSPDQVARYRRGWEELCTDLNKLTGLNHAVNDEEGEGGLQTEAVAFASYFGNFQDRKMVHTSCLDVGGGTTDISIWQENKLIHQVSVPFAGREISSHLLRRKPSFLKSLFPPSLTADISDDEARARQDRNFISRLDNIMRYGSDELLNGRLDMLTNQKSPLQLPLQQFLSLLAVSFGGIYHYLGQVQKVLREEGKLSRNTPTPVYLGGNGGRLINWIDASSSLQKGGDPDRLMEMLQINASGCEAGNASTTMSDAYKDETACGLISSGVNLSGDFDPRDDVMISGARLLINDLSFNAGDRVKLPHSMKKIERYELPDLDAIRSFVNVYDESIAKLRIRSLLPIRQLCDLDTLWGEVETEVRSLCLAKVGQEASNLEHEPGFILGLRALSNTLGRIWAERF